MVNKAFTKPAIVTGFPEIWADVLPDATIVADADVLDLQEGQYDLVIHAMSLHWSNDLVGQVIQSRRALSPDGLFLGVLFGGQTLAELRAVLAQAETEINGGLSPRVAPMAEIRDLGAILQRAGFALPVADNLSLQVSYENPTALIDDLRNMGEGNALAGRLRRFTGRRVFQRAFDLYEQNFALEQGRISASFEMIFLTGWAPDSSQPQPLRPGTATTRLADALGSEEIKLPD